MTKSGFDMEHTSGSSANTNIKIHFIVLVLPIESAYKILNWLIITMSLEVGDKLMDPSLLCLYYLLVIDMISNYSTVHQNELIFSCVLDIKAMMWSQLGVMESAWSYHVINTLYKSLDCTAEWSCFYGDIIKHLMPNQTRQSREEVIYCELMWEGCCFNPKRLLCISSIWSQPETN